MFILTPPMALPIHLFHPLCLSLSNTSITLVLLIILPLLSAIMVAPLHYPCLLSSKELGWSPTFVWRSSRSIQNRTLHYELAVQWQWPTIPTPMWPNLNYHLLIWSQWFKHRLCFISALHIPTAWLSSISFPLHAETISNYNVHNHLWQQRKEKQLETIDI